jgi:DNA-binding helix-hairpin-helix protein with protein kinase domain
LKEKLMDWRRSIEQRFRFDASRGVDPRDIANLDKEIADQRRKVEQALSTGVSTLTQIKNQILAQRRILEGQVTESYKAMLQAKADMDTASS